MSDTINAADFLGDLDSAGRKVARAIWKDVNTPDGPEDPRAAAFARAVIDEFSQLLESAPGIFQQVMQGAASAAEDLNVEPFQGLVEVIQNADDLSATEVRFAIRELSGHHQLLIVHDGAPVSYAHVLAMTLPFLTTKADDAGQKGRFGIGLKTLARISTALAVHSAPYHFKAERLKLSHANPQAALPGFYDPSTDTLLVLDLNSSFDSDAMEAWFDSWSEDGLLFLTHVQHFRWCDTGGHTILGKDIEASPWETITPEVARPDMHGLQTRTVSSATGVWTLFSADIHVPSRLARAHKATGKTTPVSIAIPENSSEGSLYIAFKTRVPCSLKISIDAQFDPSTAREELIDNAWNRWLVEKCADLVETVAAGFLEHQPKAAWIVIPISAERIGLATDRWPCKEFAAAFARVRAHFASAGKVKIGQALVAISQTAYEDARLASVLEMHDIELLAPGRKAVLAEARDAGGRWRDVLNALNVSNIVGTRELLGAFAQGLFSSKSMHWWVEVAAKITDLHPPPGIFGVPFLRSADGRPIACMAADTTARPIVFSMAVSRFSVRWELLDRLHPAYDQSEAGKRVLAWLTRCAAYTIAPTPTMELEAFAEKFKDAPVELSEVELRDLRDRFGDLRDRAASPLGLKVGSVILLNGIEYKTGKRRPRKVSPGAAYLPRSLDEHADWADAAAELPGIVWLSASYDEQLKIAGGSAARRREDGRTARGARRFLMLLGAESAPRVIKSNNRYSSRLSREMQLRQAGAHRVEFDYVSPDLERLLTALPRMPKRERRIRSIALMRSLSRHWERTYKPFQTVPAQEVKRIYAYPRGSVAADWVCVLRDTEWVSVGNGDLRTPGASVIRNTETELLYETRAFISEAVNLSAEFAAAIGLITNVRASDLVGRLEEIKSGKQVVEGGLSIGQLYRALAKLCPERLTLFERVGDLSMTELRGRFSANGGLVCMRPDEWKLPSAFFTGRDVLHKPELFVPGGPSYLRLWQALEIGPPRLADCIRVCRELALQEYSVGVDAALMDLYRYIEAMLPDVVRHAKRTLRLIPIVCDGQWVIERPIYFVEDKDLRAELRKLMRAVNFWDPPCDARELPELIEAFEIQVLTPALKVIGNRRTAADQGEAMRSRFQAAVEHLSLGLARNDPKTREQIRITWDQLRDIPLFIYQAPFAVEVSESILSIDRGRIGMTTLLTEKPLELHVWEEALQLRDSGGRAIASLFPLDVQRGIQAEWVASWMDSMERPVFALRFAADEEQREQILDAAEELAESLQANKPAAKIAVTPPASRASSAKPRRLKEFQAGVDKVTVHVGSPQPPSPPPSNSSPLAARPPSSGGSSSHASTGPAPVEYSTADLEQRGWEILVHALNTSIRPELQDFRRRRGVGADGAIDWKTFVELKASGRSMPSSIQMTNAEYERAQERGADFILALVYGLEQDERTEARLIFDPAKTLTLRPVNGVRLVGLTEATSVVLTFSE